MYKLYRWLNAVPRAYIDANLFHSKCRLGTCLETLVKNEKWKALFYRVENLARGDDCNTFKIYVLDVFAFFDSRGTCTCIESPGMAWAGALTERWIFFRIFICKTIPVTKHGPFIFCKIFLPQDNQSSFILETETFEEMLNFFIELNVIIVIEFLNYSTKRS